MEAGLRALRLGAGKGTRQSDRGAWIAAFFSREQHAASLEVVDGWQASNSMPAEWAAILRQVIIDNTARQVVGDFVRAVMRAFIDDELMRSSVAGMSVYACVWRDGDCPWLRVQPIWALLWQLSMELLLQLSMALLALLLQLSMALLELLLLQLSMALLEQPLLALMQRLARPPTQRFALLRTPSLWQLALLLWLPSACPLRVPCRRIRTRRWWRCCGQWSALESAACAAAKWTAGRRGALFANACRMNTVCPVLLPLWPQSLRRRCLLLLRPLLHCQPLLHCPLMARSQLCRH
jgi:hypothetical protein